MEYLRSLWPDFVLGFIVGMSGPQILKGSADHWTVAAFTISVAWLSVYHIRKYVDRQRKLDELCREVLGRSWGDVRKSKNT